MGNNPRLVSTKIPGLQLIKLDLRPDDRGWFKESWQKQKMEDAGLSSFMPIQQNTSFNEHKGTLRGLHAEPWDKLITVAAGSVFCAWVDLRNGKDKPVIETAILGPGESVFVPTGVANGYQTLEDKSSYTYLVNGHWQSDSKYTLINPFDEQLGVDWPIPRDHSIVSEKDQSHPSLADVELENQLTGYIIGADGQLGKQLRIEFPNFKAFSKRELELGRPGALEVLNLSSSDIVINAAAYTNVDEAETPEGITKAFRANVLGVRQLADACLKSGATLVHYSTDYVFDGKKTEAYEIDDEVCPINVYGLSKAAGEQLASFNPKTYVIRTSWVFGDGKNLISKFVERASKAIATDGVKDMVSIPTSTSALASATKWLLHYRSPFGLYHVVGNRHGTSPFNLAREIFNLVGSDPNLVTPRTYEEYFGEGFRPKRPRFTTLSSSNHPRFVPYEEAQALKEHVYRLFQQKDQETRFKPHTKGVL